MTPDSHAATHVRNSMGFIVDWQRVLADNDRWLRTVAFSRLGNQEAVDEVMQEVALAAIRQAAPVTNAGSICPWLYRLTVRQVLLYRRKFGRYRKLRNRFAETSPPTEIDPRADDPLNWLLATERRSLVRVALERLPEQETGLLLLKYIENWSCEQIAAKLGVNSNAVASRLHRARRRLRSELAALNLAEATQ